MNNLDFSGVRVKGYAKGKQFQKNHYNTLDKKGTARIDPFSPR